MLPQSLQLVLCNTLKISLFPFVVLFIIRFFIFSEHICNRLAYFIYVVQVFLISRRKKKKLLLFFNSLYLPRTVLSTMAATRTASNQSPRTPRSGGGAQWGNYFFSPSKSMFVVDPRTMATRMLVKPSIGAFESTNTRVVRFFVWVKKVSEKWFSHVFFLLGLIIYACIGGAIFNKIEGGFEAEQNVNNQFCC